MFEADKLKSLLKEYADTYTQYADESRAEAMKSLPAGAPAPAEGKILDQTRRDAFSNRAASIRAQAQGLIDRELKIIDDKLSAAPSAEAVNVVQMLAAKKTTTAEEIENLLERYGDNALTHDTIMSIAAERGVYVANENRLHRKAENLRSLRSSFVNGMNLIRAEKGNATPGYVAWMGMVIDDTFKD